MTVTIDEGQRQMILLALATLSLERPGFDYALSEIALLMDNRIADRPEMYDKFKSLNADRNTGNRDWMKDPDKQWMGQIPHAPELNAPGGIGCICLKCVMWRRANAEPA